MQKSTDFVKSQENRCRTRNRSENRCLPRFFDPPKNGLTPEKLEKSAKKRYPEKWPQTDTSPRNGPFLFFGKNRKVKKSDKKVPFRGASYTTFGKSVPCLAGHLQSVLPLLVVYIGRTLRIWAGSWNLGWILEISLLSAILPPERYLGSKVRFWRFPADFRISCRFPDFQGSARIWEVLSRSWADPGQTPNPGPWTGPELVPSWS